MGLFDSARNDASDPDFVLFQLNKKARDILRDYRNTWDVLSELMQNSVDAINQRHQEAEGGGFESGRIHLHLDAIEKEIRVYDTGKGMSSEELVRFTRPEQSGKLMGQQLGYKGKGLTACAFASIDYKVTSRRPEIDDTFHELHLENLVTWVNDNSLQSPGNVEEIPDNEPYAVDMNEEIEGWSTIVSLKLHPEYVSLENLALSTWDKLWNHFECEDDIDGIIQLLRTRTALGYVSHLFESEPPCPIEITYGMRLADGSAITGDVPYRFQTPAEILDINNEDVRSWDEQVEIATDQSASPEDRRFDVLTYSTTEPIRIGVQASKQFNCNIYISVVGQNRMNQIQEQVYGDDRDTDVKFRSGVYLSINGMPTNIECGVYNDSWNGGTYQRYYVIADADLSISSELDSGRKGISKHFAGLIVDAVIEILSAPQDSLGGVSLRSHSNSNWNSRGDEFLSFDDSHEDAVEAVRSKGELFSDVNLETLTNQLYVPRLEQDVIAAFFGLLSGGLLPGYYCIYNSSKSRYDTGFIFDLRMTQKIIPQESGVGVAFLRGTEEWFYYHKSHTHGHPFGINPRNRNAYIKLFGDEPKMYFPEFPRNQNFQSASREVLIDETRAVLCIEFKKSLSEAIGRQGFATNSKTMQDLSVVDIIVLWDNNVEELPAPWDYREIKSHQRYFPGVTHILRNSDQNTQALVIQLDVLYADLENLIRWRLHHGICSRSQFYIPVQEEE
tara:strand:- start:253 stop:2436 length:2184 start_codon:yes stop_codon:yes gene_type:complete